MGDATVVATRAKRVMTADEEKRIVIYGSNRAVFGEGYEEGCWEAAVSGICRCEKVDVLCALTGVLLSTTL